jgi:hypothetical protein
VSRERFPGVWWLSPAGAVLLVVPPTLGLAVAYSNEEFRTFFRSPKSLDTDSAVLFGAGALCFVLAALATQVGRRPAPPGGRRPWLDATQLAALRRVSGPLYALTLAGYLAFGVSAARNGFGLNDLLNALISQDLYTEQAPKSVIGTIPGVTTLTQVGIAYAIVATLLLLHGPDRTTLVRLVALGGLTTLRAFLFTERLALVELAVPALVLVAVRASQSRRPGRRLLLRMAPIPLVVLLVAGFAATEYSRSYTYYKTRTTDGLVTFSVKRLSGYYATAYNNGHLVMTYDRYPGRLPYTSLEALWTAPGAQQIDLYDRLVDRDQGEEYRRILATHANPEFNNVGGLPAVFADFGRMGGLLVLLGLGLIIGWAYRAFLHGQIAALLLYPVAVTGLLELPRFLYWSLGRTMPAVVALLVVLWVLRRAERRRPTVLPAARPLSS